jgi:hypothetical protein
MAINYTPIDDLLQKYGISVSSTDTTTSGNARVSSVTDVTKSASKEPEQISLPKEAGPSPLKTQEAITIKETVEHEEIEESVKPYVDVKPQNIKISHDLKQFGLKPIEKTKFKDYNNIVLPLSDDKIALGVHAPLNSSIRWLSTWALYLLQQSHLTIKTIHGKAVRVVKK